MKKYNVIVIFDKDMKNTLMCKRTKEPYRGMYNLVGGKIEKENDGLNEAYRELLEETNISKNDLENLKFTHPDAQIVNTGAGSTNSGWRTHERYFEMIKMYRNQYYLSESFTKYDNK